MKRIGPAHDDGEPTSRREGLPRRPRVFLVDDDPMMLAILKAQIEVARADLDITTFDCPGGAYRAVGMNPPDLLITDFMMPRHNGLEIATRARRVSPGLPILLISGTLKPRVRAEARRLDIHYFEKTGALGESH